MKKNILSLLFLTILIPVHSQQLTFKGSISKYKIEMELQKSSQEGKNIMGRYRYQGKTAYLTLTGNLYGNSIMELEESWNGNVSGTFFLEKENDSTWKGKWIGKTSFFDVELILFGGNLSTIQQPTNEDKSRHTNNTITGTYNYTEYFLNDMWFTDENPQLEIGSNGGDVLIRELSPEEIQVSFDLVWGPTYHVASINTKANKIQANTYEIKENMDGEALCHIRLTFSGKTLQLEQLSNSGDCGFGARAAAYGTYTKISNEAVIEEP